MKTPLLVLILVLLVIVVCGCTQPAPATGTKLTFDLPTTPMTTVPVPSTTTPPIPEDPVAGHWYCFVYPSWGGKVLNEFTLRDNQTWERVITEYQDTEEKEYAHGTWKKEGPGHYLLTSSITRVSHTFEYDTANDELRDTNAGLLYHRAV